MTVRVLDNNGANLWSVSEGQGIPTILLNGGPGCDDYLKPVSVLIESECQVIRFEPRGCGRSSWDGKYDLETTIQDIEFVRQAYGHDRILLIGHSFGPDLGLAYALRFPEKVLGLVGLAGGRIVNDREWHAAYSSRKHLEVLPQEFHSDPKVNEIGNKTYKQFIKQPALLRRISQLNIPAFYIAGGLDIRPNWPIQQLSELLPLGNYFEIGDADHHLWTSHSQLLQERLLGILEQIQA